MSTHTWVREPGAQVMWDSWQASHRANVELALKLLPPVESVYEVGCGSGPNLRMLRDRFPEFRLGGSEPHDTLREFANDRGFHVDESELPWAPEGWDVLVTCFCMAYVDPAVVEETFRKARSRYFIVLEPTAHLYPYSVPGVYAWDPVKLSMIAHDFLKIFRQTGWRPLWRWPIVPHYQGLNNLIVAERD